MQYDCCVCLKKQVQTLIADEHGSASNTRLLECTALATPAMAAAERLQAQLQALLQRQQARAEGMPPGRGLEAFRLLAIQSREELSACIEHWEELLRREELEWRVNEHIPAYAGGGANLPVDAAGPQGGGAARAAVEPPVPSGWGRHLEASMLGVEEQDPRESEPFSIVGCCCDDEEIRAENEQLRQ